MNGKLIVLEGIDGSGKATQSGLLEDHLIKSGKDVMHISFPDYGSPSSALVKMYLNGDFGSAPEDVNPYAASMLYAVDRFASFRTKWKSFYESGGIFKDKHRSRLPVLYIRKHDILKVKWADNDSKYISINKEMRKELKKIYDDSEIESINS